MLVAPSNKQGQVFVLDTMVVAHSNKHDLVLQLLSSLGTVSCNIFYFLYVSVHLFFVAPGNNNCLLQVVLWLLPVSCLSFLGVIFVLFWDHI